MSETWGVVKAQSTQKENGRRDERTAKAFPANYILPSSWNTSRGKILLHIFDSFSPSNKLSNVNFCLANLFGIFLPSHASIILSRFDFAFLSISQIQGWTLSKIQRGGFLCQTKSEVFVWKYFNFPTILEATFIANIIHQRRVKYNFVYTQRGYSLAFLKVRHTRKFILSPAIVRMLLFSKAA